MKKRLLSTILSMAVCVSALPMSAFASGEMYDVWVNGEQFYSGNPIIKCGDGTAEFDPDTNKLTLTDVTLTDYYEKFVIYAEQNIDIVTEGINVINAKCGGIRVNGDLTLSGEGSLDIITGGSEDNYNGIYTVNGDLTVDMTGKLTINTNYYGLNADNDLKVTGIGDIDITAGEDGLYSEKGDIILSGSGNIKISDTSCGISAGTVEIAGSGDINIEDSEYGICANFITLSGTGDFIATAKEVGIGIFGGDLVLSGTGKVDITSQEYNAVLFSDSGCAVLLNGENSEVKFTTSDGNPAVYIDDFSGGAGAGNVAGNNIGKYDVEGAPGKSSVKYTLKTYTVTFDIGEHGTAPENQKIVFENKAEKPTAPEADRWTFEGWYTDKECTNEYDFATPITENITLYAKWSCLHENTEVRDAKDVTCTEDGYTGDTYCLDCEKIIEEGKAIPAIEHTWEKDFTVDKEPTYEEEGSKSIHCAKCEATKDITAIPTLEPTNTPTPSPEPSGEPTPTPTPELNAGDFVDRCYEVPLASEADQQGYNYWKNQLVDGEACGAQAGFGFIFSAEYASKNTTNEQFVTDMYSMFFGREADEAGYNYWLEQLKGATATREQVFAGFANSEEFYNLCSKYGVVSGAYIDGVSNEQQGGVNCFVARLYKVCLNRLPDQAGQVGWVMKLMNGEVTGSSCSYGFVFSPEFVNMNLDNTDFVKYMYNAFFGREADEEGLNYWVDMLNGETATREDVFNGFTGSVEFANLCTRYGINA